MFSRLFASKPKTPTLLSRSEYAVRYAAFLAERMPDTTITRKGEDLHLAWPDDATMDLFLGNAYADYTNDPEALAAIFEAAIAIAVHAHEDSGTFDPTVLLPVIKTRSWRETSLVQIGQPTDSQHAPIIRSLVGDLLLAYALDLPGSIDYVKPADLPEGWDETALHNRALANLAERASGLQIVGGEGRYRVELDGFFDTSLALIASAWIDRIEIEGDPVFALPSRDELMVCGSKDRESLASLAELAPQIAAKSSYALSTGLYLFRDGQLHIL